MNKLLLDSNIIIGVVKGRFSVSQLEKPSLIVSEITRLEIFGYHKLQLQEEKLLDKFFRNIDCLPISKIIINQAIKFRKQKSMSVGDSIIAATASVYELPIATANIKDFKHLEYIALISPLEI
ncbi:type II toxin-antitoxin system VapC family toxin [Salegentibacter sp. JZCK2]|uniref:type II toxin-antitoxin system VapC family toxin n=1 Tax=Salegentibacter tibetensis TaxID=2873600 RepID=UPI001CCCCEE4|nr:type II toxin-antitoxin system VapC family toxin [Salegentibacter tibetensis]MBZ9728748.1 type II toxin-antitoxin system VapC family toxin [Salegentibacter tibetensis]